MSSLLSHVRRSPVRNGIGSLRLRSTAASTLLVATVLVGGITIADVAGSDAASAATARIDRAGTVVLESTPTAEDPASATPTPATSSSAVPTPATSTPATPASATPTSSTPASADTANIPAAAQQGVGYAVCLLADGAACDGFTLPGPPTVVVAPTPVPEIVPTTFGGLTWSFAREAPADKTAEITRAMDYAITNLNTVANYRGNVSVTYNPGVPTAQASFGGWIEFGGSISGGVAVHELGHWLGSGTVWQYDRNRDGNRWTGIAATTRLREWEGTDAMLSSDRAHFWPYGWNYDNEYSNPQREIGIVSAQRADMGMSDGVREARGVFRLQNRSTAMFLDLGALGTTGISTRAAIQSSNAGTLTQRWAIDLSPAGGYRTLVNTTTSVALDSSGRTITAAAVITDAADPLHAFDQQWELVPTDGGWFQLRNRTTGLCLDTGGQTATASAMQSWPCGGWIHNQQWRLTR